MVTDGCEFAESYEDREERLEREHDADYAALKSRFDEARQLLADIDDGATWDPDGQGRIDAETHRAVQEFLERNPAKGTK